MAINPENIEVFLNDLTQITKRHGIVIHGCGCCNSPSLFEIENYKRHEIEESEEQDWRYRHLQDVAEPEIEFGPKERKSHRRASI